MSKMIKAVVATVIAVGAVFIAAPAASASLGGWSYAGNYADFESCEGAGLSTTAADSYCTGPNYDGSYSLWLISN